MVGTFALVSGRTGLFWHLQKRDRRDLKSVQCRFESDWGHRETAGRRDFELRLSPANPSQCHELSQHVRTCRAERACVGERLGAHVIGIQRAQHRDALGARRTSGRIRDSAGSALVSQCRSNCRSPGDGSADRTPSSTAVMSATVSAALRRRRRRERPEPAPRRRWATRLPEVARAARRVGDRMGGAARRRAQ
jgi:hypothetical protein